MSSAPPPLDVLVLVTATGDATLVREAADIALTAAAFERRTGFLVLDGPGPDPELLAMLRDTGVDPLDVAARPEHVRTLVATSRTVIALP